MEDRLFVRKTESGQVEVALQEYCAGYYDKYSAVAGTVYEAIDLMAKHIKYEISRNIDYLEELNFLPIE